MLKRLSIAGAVALIAVLAGSFWLRNWAAELEERVEARFQGRLFALPSKIYSGPLLLYPEVDVGRVGLLERLERMNYHVAGSAQPSVGEYVVGPESIEVNRRPFEYPHRSDPGGRILLQLDDRARVLAMFDSEGREHATVEIEPELIAQLRGEAREDRRVVALDEISPLLIEAIIEVEDSAFYEHNGLHLWRIAGALFANLRAGHVVQGGSTLTQQLVKNFYLTREQTLSRKFTEAAMALLLERNHDKSEILEAYLNEIYMGQRGSIAVHGMAEAAHYYLAKNVRDLSLADAALLASIIKGPNRYSPQRHPERALKRRNLVLRVLFENQRIPRETYESAIALDLGVHDFPSSPNPSPYFVEFLRQDLARVYGDAILRSEGMSIYTTLDARLQRAANRAVRDGLRSLETGFPELERPDSPLQAAVVAIAPRTGDILAMVGGRDYASTQFNRATQAHRQPGSVFKPIVALAGLAANGGPPHFTLASTLEDEPLVLELPNGEWAPENYDGEYRGPVSLRRAIEESLNVPVARMGIAVGPERVIETARRMGIESPLDPLPSIALGAFEITVLEAARAYSVLASGGVVPELRSYTEIVHVDGRVLERQDRNFVQAFEPAEVYLVTSALNGAVERGTGRRLRQLGFKGPLAGKTGTSSDFRDAWFIGFTPDLVIAVWVGFDDGKSLGVPGSVAALPIFARVLEAARGKEGSAEFLEPPGIERIEINRETGLRAGLNCPGEAELFLAGSAPDDYCGGGPNPVDRVFEWLRKRL
ncbi:MAG: PBP1A family penicillin-binding protein [bacterium]|nr:PBP1A family penicillin-binding protein [bacterium]